MLLVRNRQEIMVSTPFGLMTYCCKPDSAGKDRGRPASVLAVVYECCDFFVDLTVSRPCFKSRVSAWTGCGVVARTGQPSANRRNCCLCRLPGRWQWV